MDKLEMKTMDIVKNNINSIKELFPDCITETIGGKGNIIQNVDMDKLKMNFSNSLLESDEKYEFTWAGKRAAFMETHRSTSKTLRPIKEKSENWDKTSNIYIEGDNLEALKLLQESYMGKVKIIYIDPPYNTGNDFIYNDDFRISDKDYAERIGTYDENNNRLIKNTDSNGRFHSDWCSMIYSRLLLARNLLSNDGIIFISIDDNEDCNLKKICDEVFGEYNFINHFAWVSNITGRQISGSGAAKTWESIFAYAKNASEIPSLSVDTNFAKRKMPSAYKGFDKDIREDKYGTFAIGDTLYNHNRKFNEETRKNLVFSIFYSPETEEIRTGEIGKKIQGFVEILPHANGDGIHKYHAWRWSKQKIENESYNLIVLKNRNGYEIYTRIRDYNKTTLKDIITNISNGDTEVQKLFKNRKYFDYPKSVDLLVTLLGSINDPEAIILDFFGGSSTTAHAVMKLNAQDNGNRHYIMVQIPEKTEKNTAAYLAGFETVCDIGEKRIKLAAKNLHSEFLDADFDDGFRVFSVDESNMKDVYYAPEDLGQQNLDSLTSNIKEDRTDLDLLFGCVLDWGLPLSMPYTSEKIGEFTVHTYNDGDLIACFDENISEDVIKTIAKRHPLRAVFRDSSFANSPAKINVEEIFKLLSPDTSVKVI